MHERCPISAQFKPFDLSNPFPFYAQARDEKPIFYSEELGYWVVTRLSAPKTGSES